MQAKRPKYFADNTTRNAKRQAARVARKFGNKGAFLTKFTARAVRRAAGDLKPVNPLASLQQAPEAKFARGLSQVEKYKILGMAVDQAAVIAETLQATPV